MSNVQIAIVGYHRSGTSAIAQNCQAGGLFVGDDLLGSKPSNPFGHYEDREFFDINEAILHLNSIRWDTIYDVMPVVRPEFFTIATDLVSKRNAEVDVWGFKDPRTCVFLDFWHSVLPNPKYLICLRHYTACIDSILRRRRRDYQGMHDHARARQVSVDMMNPDTACANWCVYMSAVLRFLVTRKPDTLVVRVDKLSSDMSVTGTMNDRFGVDLEPITIGETFRPDLFQSDELLDLSISPELKATAEHLWDQLIQFEDEMLLGSTKRKLA